MTNDSNIGPVGTEGVSPLQNLEGDKPKALAQSTKEVPIPQLGSGQPGEVQNREEILQAAEDNIEVLSELNAPPSLNQVAQETAKAIASTIKARGEVADKGGALIRNIRSLALPNTLSRELFTDMMSRTGKNLGASEELSRWSVAPFQIADMSIALPATFSKGALLIYKKSVLSAMKKHIRSEANNEQQKAELTKWHEQEKAKLKSELIMYGFGSAITVPRSTSYIMSLAGKSIAAVGAAFSWTIGIALTAMFVYEYRKSSKALKKQKEAMDGIKKHSINPASLEENAAKIKKQREKTRIAREVAYRNEFDATLANLGVNAKETLEKKGFPQQSIDIITAFAMRKVEIPAEEKKNLFREYLEHRQTLSVLWKQGLQGLALEKQKTERKFLKFAKRKMTLNYSSKILGFSVMATFKTLVLAGVIATSTLAIAISGIGIGVAVTGLLLAGLIMLYRYKPNLMKELARMTGVRIAFKELPIQIKQLRLARKQLHVENALQITARITECEAKYGTKKEFEPKASDKEILKKLGLPTKGKVTQSQFETALGKLRDKISRETTQMVEKRDEIQNKINNLEDNLKPLQKRIRDAKRADFLRSLGMEKEDAEERLTEALFGPEGTLDEETSSMLKETMGIELPKGSEDDRKLFKVKLKEFFAWDEEKVKAFAMKRPAAAA